jgi:hypothetical protein
MGRCAARCLAYAPPGALITEELAEYCKSFTVSFVMGRDLVGRLSIQSLRKMRDDILTLIARCRVNKAYVIKSMLNSDSRAMVAEMLHPEDQIPPSEFYNQLKASQGRYK